MTRMKTTPSTPSRDVTRPPADSAGGRADTTADVGSEGGSPGDVEVVRDEDRGAGSEAAETWRPDGDGAETIARDETGKGRRSP